MKNSEYENARMIDLRYMDPMTVFSLYEVTTEVAKGVLPSAYLVALVAMLQDMLLLIIVKK